MKTPAQLEVVVPFVHRAVCSLRASERGMLEANAAVPADPLVRAALRAGVDHTLDRLEALRRALETVRRSLGSTRSTRAGAPRRRGARLHPSTPQEEAIR
jgi:hypothetical protein